MITIPDVLTKFKKHLAKDDSLIKAYIDSLKRPMFYHYSVSCFNCKSNSWIKIETVNDYKKTATCSVCGEKNHIWHKANTKVIARRSK